MQIKGLVTVSGAFDENGNNLSLQKLVDRGNLPSIKAPRGWGVERDEVCVGKNLTMLNMRQYLAYLFGYKAPVSNYVCANFGLGTGTTAPNVTDVALNSPINFYNNGTSYVGIKPINGIDFPEPYAARVTFTIGVGEANGFAITELGLFSGDGTLMARKTQVALNKDSSFSPVLTWRIKF